MTRQQMKKKILEIQRMVDLEFSSFEEKLCVSDLEMVKKELLFKAIDIRKNRLSDIDEAMAVCATINDGDSDE